MLDFEKFTEQPDGSIICEATVNSLGEIAGWVVIPGEGVKVIYPPELKENALALAKGVMKNYG